jgi:YhcH/YjgK/YiaL family protein
MRRMVKDLLTCATRYYALGPRFVRALNHAVATDYSALPDGTYPVGGDDVRALVQRYTTKPHHEGRWEAHRDHIDLQMVISGEELIGVAPLPRLIAEPYDAERDLLWLTGEGDRVTLRPGEFMLLWPEDGHMPGLAVAAPVPVLKVVFKIAV